MWALPLCYHDHHSLCLGFGVDVAFLISEELTKTHQDFIFLENTKAFEYNFVYSVIIGSATRQHIDQLKRRIHTSGLLLYEFVAQAIKSNGTQLNAIL